MSAPTAIELSKLDGELSDVLPVDYRDFIESYDGYQLYEHPKAKGKEWQLAALCPEYRCSSIFDPSFVDSSLMYWQQSSAWADQIEEFTGRNSTRVTDSRKRFKLDRLRNCITIGEENSDFLLLDPSDDFSVWILWHDGNDLQRLSDSFDYWIRSSTPMLNPPTKEKTSPELMEKALGFCGTWFRKTATSSVRLSLSEDGSAAERFDDDSGGDGNWRLIDNETLGISIINSTSKSEEEQHKVLRCSPEKLSLLELKYKYRTDWTRQQ